MGGSCKPVVSCALIAGALAAACGNGGRREVQQIRGHLSVEPSLLDVGSVALGKETRKTLTLRNDGVAPMTIQVPDQLLQQGVLGKAGSGGEWIVDALPLTLRSGETRKIDVVFHPASVGTRDLAVPLMTSSAMQEQVALQLAGKGVLGLARLSSDTIDFGDVVVGEKAVQILTLVNIDNAFTEVTLSPLGGKDASAFTVNVQGAKALAPEQQLTVQLEFAPGKERPFAGSIDIVPCPTCGRRTVQLLGNGALRVVEVAPSAIDFGDVQAGTSAARGFSLTNKSKDVVTIKEMGIAGQGPVEIALDGGLRPPLTLSAGQVLQGTAIFRPDSLGARAGKAIFGTSDGAPPELAFTGFSYGPLIVATPGWTGQIAALMNTARNETLRLTNAGLDPKALLPLTISSATIQGPGAQAWSVQTPALPWVLGEPGASSDLQVAFTPPAPGVYGATLVLQSNDMLHRTLSIALDGLGRDLPPCKAHLAPAPPVEFGLVSVGQPSTMGFELVNDGEWDCILGGPKLVSGEPAFSWPGGSAPSGRQIPPHGRMSVRVQLLTSAAVDYAGEVRMYFSNPANTTLSVPLRGSGDSGCFVLAPGALDFGGGESGCSLPAQTAYARNWCGQAITITALDVPPPFSLGPDAPKLPATIQPNDTLSIPVLYHPGTPGDDVAALRVTTSAKPKPYQLGLTGGSIAEQLKTDTWNQSTPKVDLLFVVDNSGSMAQMQKLLQENAGVLWDRIALASADYHIAVTSSGMYPYTAGWTQCAGGAGGGEAGRFFPVDGSRPRMLTPQTPDVQNVFIQNLNVGLCHWDERFSEPIIAAVSPPLSNSTAPDGNAGFLRDDARLGIVAYTDTDDDNKMSAPPPIDNLVKALRDAKHGALDLVSFTAITPFSECSIAEAKAVRFFDIAKALNGHLEDACDTDHLGARLSGALDHVLVPLTSFPLSARPRDPTKIQVTVNRQAVTAFSYDAGPNRIVFAQENAPPPGSHIEATYEVACN